MITEAEAKITSDPAVRIGNEVAIPDALTETIYIDTDNSLAAGELRAEEDIAAGRVMEFETLEDFKKYLENS